MTQCSNGKTCARIVFFWGVEVVKVHFGSVVGCGDEWALLPCFIIVAFTKNMGNTDPFAGINIILWATVLHVVLIVVNRFYYKNQDISKDDKILLSNIMPMGNIAFVGTAICTLLYGADGMFVGTMYSIVNRVILNTICIVSFSGLELTRKDIGKILLNPIFVITMVCMAVFFGNSYAPQVTINGQTVSIFQIDVTLPFVYEGILQLGSILTTMVWLNIGSSITKESIHVMTKTPYSIKFAFIKIIINPIFSIILYIAVSRLFNLKIEPRYLPAAMMMSITPVPNSLAIFAIKYNRSPNLCIACLLTTMAATLLLFPVYDIIFQFLMSKNII